MKTTPRCPVWSRFAFLAFPILLAGCGTGTPHLQRPLVYHPYTTFPPSIVAAEEGVAKAKAGGAVNVLDARYPLARAEAFLLNAKEEYLDGDPTSIVDQFATVALNAANEALRIAQQAPR